MKIYDIKKAYDNGIENLYMGGEFQEENFFREKDVLEEDYSNPVLSGIIEITSIEKENNNIYSVKFNGGCLLLTEEEFNAGLIIKGE